MQRRHDAPRAQIAKDFGTSDATLYEWLKKADIEDGVREGLSETDATETRELNRRNRVLEQEVEVLSRATPSTSPRITPQNAFTLIRELAEDGIPVTVTCRVLKFSLQGYYKWMKNPVTKRDLANAHLTNLIVDVHFVEQRAGGFDGARSRGWRQRWVGVAPCSVAEKRAQRTMMGVTCRASRRHQLSTIQG